MFCSGCSDSGIWNVVEGRRVAGIERSAREPDRDGEVGRRSGWARTAEQAGRRFPRGGRRWRGSRIAMALQSREQEPLAWSETEHPLVTGSRPRPSPRRPWSANRSFWRPAEGDRRCSRSLCFDRAPGKRLYPRSMKEEFETKGTAKTTTASGSVACDGSRLFIASFPTARSTTASTATASSASTAARRRCFELSDQCDAIFRIEVGEFPSSAGLAASAADGSHGLRPASHASTIRDMMK